MEIEQLAVERPEALAKVAGRRRSSASTRAKADGDRRRRRLRRLESREQVTDVLVKLWEVFVEEDATLVEVNPLVKTADGQILALDGKVTLDDNADFRHPDHEALEDKDARPTRSSSRPRRTTSTTSSSTARSASSATARAWSCARSTSSPTPARSTAASEAGQLPRHRRRRLGRGDGRRPGVILGDPQVKSVFVNVFGGITACDAVANGIVQALADARATARRHQAARRPARRQQRRARAGAILADAATTRSSSWSTPWTTPRAARPPSWRSA